MSLLKTTDLCIAAHQDDVEIMAYGPIVECYKNPKRSFSAVIVTDGAGSPRSGDYAQYTDEEMQQVRFKEQENASKIGEYLNLVALKKPSSQVKDKTNDALVDEIYNIILQTSPEKIYTHNLADKHDTHVAVCTKVIKAVKKLPKDKRPKVYMLEVWRGLDWLCDSDKVVFDTSKHPNLASALLGVYDSQISGGKRYDLAALGRRTANATFFESHNVDQTDSINFGIDITDELDKELDEIILKYIENFKADVLEKVRKFI